MSKKRKRQNDKQPKKANEQFGSKGAEVISVLQEGSISLESLAKGVKPFFKYFWEFLHKPFSFVKYINYGDKHVLRNSFIFFSYSLAIYYIIMLPAFIYHEQSVDRFSFYVKIVAEYTLYILITHGAIKILGGKGRFHQTLSGYFFSFGFVIPIYALLILPVYLKFGTDLFVFPNISDVSQFQSTMLTNPSLWYLYYLILQLIFGITNLILYFKFAGVIHKISWVKLLIANILFGIIRIPLFFFIIYPIFQFITPFLEKVADLIL